MEALQMRLHTPLDDRQLWRTVEDSGRSWPVYATPSEADGNCYFVELALPCETSAQWKFVNHWLSSAAFDSDGTHWLIRHRNFEQLFLKCQGVTPRFYWKWPTVATNDPETPQMPTPDTFPDILSVNDDFIRYCCAENGWPNFPVVQGMFALISKCAVHWLLVKRRPLELGFATVYALPYRKNWQAIVAHDASKRWPNIASVLRRKKHRMGILDASGFIPSLHDTRLIGMASDETFSWSLSITETKAFTKTAEKLERETLANTTPARYVMRLGALIRKAYVDIVTVTADYFAKANAPMGYVDTTRARNNLELRPKMAADRRFPVKSKGQPDDPFSPPVAPATQSECASAVDASPAQEVQAVPPAEHVTGTIHLR